MPSAPIRIPWARLMMSPPSSCLVGWEIDSMQRTDRRDPGSNLNERAWTSHNQARHRSRLTTVRELAELSRQGGTC